jgi:hypothetical protein
MTLHAPSTNTLVHAPDFEVMYTPPTNTLLHAQASVGEINTITTFDFLIDTNGDTLVDEDGNILISELYQGSGIVIHAQSTNTLVHAGN